jgi:hypothetical protein
MEGLNAAPKNLVRDSRERVRNRVGAHVEDELAKSTITLGLGSSDRESIHLEELGMFLDLQVLIFRHCFSEIVFQRQSFQRSNNFSLK